MATQPDLIGQLTEIRDLADRHGVVLRALGGVAVYLHAQHPRLEPWRSFGDLDFIGRFKDAAGIKQVFADLGFESDHQLNTLHGRYRLIFEHPGTSAKVDVLLDVFQMCHRLPLLDRLALDSPTIPLADLLLTKLQILELNRKDAEDVAVLVASHPVGSGDAGEINLHHIARLTSTDWGLFHTVARNLERMETAEMPAGVSQLSVVEKLRAVRQAMEAAPKSMKWRMRARVGERYPWYEEVEEVNR